MNIHPNQLRHLISDVLTEIGLYTRDARELLMLTTAQETHCGGWITQICGPALGIFQIEPKTHNDIWNNFLNYKPELALKINQFYFHLEDKEIEINLNLTGNLPYQIAICRADYLREKEPLPSYNDITGLANYYKKYWNSFKGKATIEEAINNYKKYALFT